jgi:hypothetical protein
MASLSQMNRKEPVMQKNLDIETIGLRLAAISAGVEALARSLPRAEAARASAAIREHVRWMIDNKRIPEGGEDAIRGDVARILDALERPGTLPGDESNSMH